MNSQINLLTSIIRYAPHHPAGLAGSLSRVIVEHNVVPDWENTPLPPDRPPRACKTVYEDLLRSRAAPYPPVNYWQPTQALPQILPQPTSVPRKRSADQEPPTPGGRPIQPRPPFGEQPFQASSGSMGILSPAQNSPGEAGRDQLPPKKRGRPSRADREAQIAAAEARGETFQPPKKRPPKKPPVSPSSSMQIDRVVTPTVEASGPSSVSSEPNPVVRPPPSPESRRDFFQGSTTQEPSASQAASPATNRYPPLQQTGPTGQFVPQYPPAQSSPSQLPKPSWAPTNTSAPLPPYGSSISATAAGTEGPIIPNRESSRKAMTSTDPQFPPIQSGP
ncbi:MAG: hypothetical protein Q9227_005186 [Pyrenula ochraceoflavens]